MLNVWMKRFLVLVVLVSPVRCGPESPKATDGVPTPEYSEGASTTGKFLGYVATERKLASRLFDNPKMFQMRQYLGGYETDVFKLVGVQSGTGLEADFINAAPNSVNMLLWFATFDRLAQELVLRCSGEEAAPFGLEVGSVSLRADVLEDIRGVCAEEDGAWEGLWDSLMALDSTQAEQQAWLGFVKALKADGAAVDNILRQALVAMWLNPYFLLAR